MKRRAIWLFILDRIAAKRRFADDFAKNVVVLICAAIICGLFAYILQDFVGFKVRDISIELQEAFSAIALNVGLGLSAFFLGRHLLNYFSAPEILGQFVLRIGEASDVRWWFLGLVVPYRFFINIVLPWFALSYLLPHQSSSMAKIVLICSIIFLTFLGVFLERRQRQSTELSPPQGNRSHLSPLRRPDVSVLRWRLRSFFARNFFARIVGVMVLCLASSQFLLDPGRAGILLHQLLAYIVGAGLAWAVITQVAFDLRYSQFEKGLGISHDQFLGSLTILAQVVGLAGGLLSLCFAVAALASAGTLAQTEWSALGKIFFAAYITPSIVPYFVFQIDARRSFVTLLTILLAGLFIVTAILATWFGLLLLPIVAYYGFTSQKDRYYRA